MDEEAEAQRLRGVNGPAHPVGLVLTNFLQQGVIRINMGDGQDKLEGALVGHLVQPPCRNGGETETPKQKATRERHPGEGMDLEPADSQPLL